jgi:hypothetical protein
MNQHPFESQLAVFVDRSRLQDGGPHVNDLAAGLTAALLADDSIIDPIITSDADSYTFEVSAEIEAASQPAADRVLEQAVAGAVRAMGAPLLPALTLGSASANV